MLSTSPLGGITSVGVTGDIKAQNKSVQEDLPKIPITWNEPTIKIFISTGLFLSIGTLRAIRRLNVRRVGKRCVGLWIQYTNGGVEILGQWDPSQYSSISEIYSDTKGNIASVSFTFWDRSSLRM
jgi:hypothetical protein